MSPHKAVPLPPPFGCKTLPSDVLGPLSLKLHSNSSSRTQLQLPEQNSPPVWFLGHHPRLICFLLLNLLTLHMLSEIWASRGGPGLLPLMPPRATPTDCVFCPQLWTLLSPRSGVLQPLRCLPLESPHSVTPPRFHTGLHVPLSPQVPSQRSSSAGLSLCAEHLPLPTAQAS